MDTSEIDTHRRSPDVSFQAHVIHRKLELTERLRGLRAIYLDTKFWVILRDVVLGRRCENAENELLATLRRQVQAGSAFCPISETTFFELLKQSDPHTRLVTANLVDELSMGVALAPFDERVALEIRQLVHHFHPEPKPKAPLSLCWTKLACVLGAVSPTNTRFDLATELALQKAFLDSLWQMSLAEMVEMIGDALPLGEEAFQSLAMKLNEGNSEHASELRSFEDAYAKEAVGPADIFALMMAQIMNGYQELATGQRSPEEGEFWEQSVRVTRNLLAGSLRKKESWQLLRTLHIKTCLHASLRWNKGEKFDPNDFPDFHHAAAALAYCDVFLTDGPLKARITSKKLGLDVRFSCVVASDVAGATDALRGNESGLP